MIGRLRGGKLLLIPLLPKLASHWPRYPPNCLRCRAGLSRQDCGGDSPHLQPGHHSPTYYCIKALSVPSSIYSRSHSFTGLFTRSFIHCFVHPSIHPSIHHSFMKSFIHGSVHSSIHSFIPLFIHSFVHSFVHPFIHHVPSPRVRCGRP